MKSSKKRFFHATRITNITSILEQGILPKFGEIYLTDSLDSALRWMGFRFQAMGDNTMAIVEVEVNEKKLVTGTDHSPLMQKIFGCGKSLVSHEVIKPSQIIKVHYYQIKRPNLKSE